MAPKLPPSVGGVSGRVRGGDGPKQPEQGHPDDAGMYGTGGDKGNGMWGMPDPMADGKGNPGEYRDTGQKAPGGKPQLNSQNMKHPDLKTILGRGLHTPGMLG